MRKTLTAITLTLFLTLILPGQRNETESLRVKWEKLLLPNGMRILLMPDARESEVSVEFWLHTGARDEAMGKQGLAHFFEHATPYGFQNDAAARAQFRSMLTDSNAQTQKDYTRYYVKLKPEGLDLVLRYEAERMTAN